MRDKCQKTIDEFNKIEQALSDPEIYNNQKKFVELSQKRKSFEEKIRLAKKFLAIDNQKNEAEELLKSEKDPEMLTLARAELEKAKRILPKIEAELKIALIPQDPNDNKNAIVEIRPGAGGDESSLFAQELSRMILRFIEKSEFKTEILSEIVNDGGGLKELILKVDGFGAFGKLKFEGGVHRVQRIPVTESQGRVHTSAVSVVVMPEVTEKDFKVNEADVRVDVFRSSGCGGQSVNTTDSAVRLTHTPTGIVVTCQDEKSQLKNKNKAFGVLRARLAAIEIEKREKELGEKRLSMIGSGDRSDKIRTYNFPQDRVTDHRIGQNFSDLPKIMDGEIAKIIEALELAEQQNKLEN